MASHLQPDDMLAALATAGAEGRRSSNIERDVLRRTTSGCQAGFLSLEFYTCTCTFGVVPGSIRYYI